MQKALKFLSLAGKLVGLLAGLGSYAEALPPKWAPIGAILFGASSILKDAINRLGDLLDDGKVNQSFTAK